MEKYRRYLLVMMLSVIAVAAIVIFGVWGEARGAGSEAPAKASHHHSPASPDQAISAAPDATHTITFANFAYTPSNLVIDPGDTVEWQGSFSNHPLVSDDGLWPTVGTGSTFSYTFNNPGVYRYHCAIHGGPNGQGMSGMVTVLADIRVYLPLLFR